MNTRWTIISVEVFELPVEVPETVVQHGDVLVVVHLSR